MSKYYPSNYYSFFVANETRYTNPVKSMLLKMRSQAAIWNGSLLGNVVGTLSERLDLKSLRHVSLTHDSRILDVGCGNGFLLYDLMQAGFTALKGVDPTSKSQSSTKTTWPSAKRPFTRSRASGTW
jgi:2-polyprenyl-3-methyl-5-hydroxy-6-metoxy-1,4-benzoquinol methylase